MKKNFKRLCAATAIAGAAFATTTIQAEAANIDVGATVIFRQGVQLSGVVDMDFTTVDYLPTTAGTAVLDPNGAGLSCTGGLTCSGNGTAGAVDIDGETLATVEITCETSGTISDGTNALTIDTVQMRINGATTACAGLGTSPVNFDLTAGTDTMNLGATIQVPAAGVLAAGTYNTTLGTGDPINVQVVYQ